MTEALVCWRCGALLADLSLPFGRADCCRACGAELHACRLCRFYDTSKAKSCAEPVAEEVGDKERANYCDYFVATPGAWRPKDPAADRSRTALEALFGPKK